MNSCPVSYELYSSVSAKEVNWLWYPYIPYGKLTILQGDPGCGKSTFIMDLVASVTTGKVLLDGKTRIPQNVIYQCSEDDAADTIKPRLTAAGADCSKVAYINEDLFGFSIDDEVVRNTIFQFGAKLLVIDPFQAYLGDADLSNTMSMRRVLRRLSMWASQYDCAIILVGHLNKKSSSKELYRGLGSIDVVAAARSVLQLDFDEEDNSKRIIRHVKSSLAPKGEDLLFRISESGGIQWGATSCAAGMGTECFEESTLLAFGTTKQELVAGEMLKILECGEQEANEVVKHLSKYDIGTRTIRTVKKTLGVKSIKRNGTWYWSLPIAEDISDAETV